MLYNCDESELLKVLTREEIDFIDNLKIPYQGAGHLWAKKWFIDEKVHQAKIDGVIAEIKQEAFQPVRVPGVISDYVPDGAIKSMVDGQMYDSKSRYYKSLKENGMHIVGNEKQKPKAEFQSDITGRDIKNAIERLESGN